MADGLRSLAVMDVSPEMLGEVVSHLPRSHRIVGSRDSRDGYVRLLVDTPEVVECGRVQLLVREESGKRTAEVVPAP